MSGSGPGNIAPSLAGLPTDPEARDVLAAEHVLGTIDAAGAARVVVAVESDTAWRDAVAAWETRLASLVMLQIGRAHV